MPPCVNTSYMTRSGVSSIHVVNALALFAFRYKTTTENLVACMVESHLVAGLGLAQVLKHSCGLAKLADDLYRLRMVLQGSLQDVHFLFSNGSISPACVSFLMCVHKPAGHIHLTKRCHTIVEPMQT